MRQPHTLEALTKKVWFSEATTESTLAMLYEYLALKLNFRSLQPYLARSVVTVFLVVSFFVQEAPAEKLPHRIISNDQEAEALYVLFVANSDSLMLAFALELKLCLEEILQNMLPEKLVDFELNEFPEVTVVIECDAPPEAFRFGITWKWPAIPTACLIEPCPPSKEYAVEML